MKKVMYAAVAMLLMAGAVSCKKSGEEIKSTDNQTETMASETSNGASNLSTNPDESDTMGDASVVDTLLDFLTEYGNQIKQVKNRAELEQLMKTESPKFTSEQIAYTLTAEDKTRIEKAYDELYDILIPVAVKYKVIDRNTAENVRKELKKNIQEARNIKGVC